MKELFLGCEIALTMSHHKILALDRHPQRSEGAVALGIGGSVAQAVLAAQFLVDLLESLAEILDLAGVVNLAAGG
jgi:hypothetical protein